MFYTSDIAASALWLATLIGIYYKDGLPTCQAGCFMCKILKESLPYTVSTHTYNSSAKGDAMVHILNIKLYLI